MSCRNAALVGCMLITIVEAVTAQDQGRVASLVKRRPAVVPLRS